MTFKVGNRSYEDELSRFAGLLDSFQDFLTTNGLKTKVRSTKLGGYEEELKNIGHLGTRDAAGLAEIIARYNQLDVLFSSDSKIRFKPKDLYKIFKGKSVLHDANEEYNDIFFELSMAVRCAASFSAVADVDMTSICDVILDGQFAVECKYLHGERGFRDNVGKGLAQLDQRVAAGLAKKGFVAIDLSALLDKDKIWTFSQEVFKCFLSSNEVLCEKKKIEKAEILLSIANDRNFESIISSYIAHQAEFVFRSNLGSGEIQKMGRNCLAIVYQYSNALCFEDNSVGRIPVPVRGTSYFLNPELDEQSQAAVKGIIHSMATGI